MNLPELLSPAGGMEQLKAAVENGADAVYMGGRAFNARINAANFGEDELTRAIEYAHVRGVHIYITMNTLISDGEMQRALDAAGQAFLAGADALIVQDLGFASLLRRHIPGLPLHLSTQGTVYSAGGILALSPLGFSRVILARELSLSEISDAAKRSPVPVEVFAHGALCVCYSGQCLMSSMIGGRSGNRGLCAQPCRLPYALGQSRGYLMSPKDLCTLDVLPALVSSGVAALKIEGRMKSPEYVAIVTAAYRKHLNRCAEGGVYRVDGRDRQDLLQVFNRGEFTTGYLGGRPGRALISRGSPKHGGVPVGTVVGRGKAGAVEVNLTGVLRMGDGVEIPARDFPGGVVTYLSVAGRRVNEAGPGPAAVGEIVGAVRPGDAVRKITDRALMERAAASYAKPRRKVPVYGTLTARAGEPLRLVLRDGEGREAAAVGGPAEAAVTRPLTRETALAQLMKTGDSPFALVELTTALDGRAAARLSELNALRREALGKLAEARARRYHREALPAPDLQPPGRNPRAAEAGLSLFLYRRRDDLAGVLHLADRAYLPFEQAVLGQIRPGRRPKEMMAWLPPVSAGNLDALVARHAAGLKALGLDGVLLGSAAQIGLLRESGLPLLADASFNAFNGHTIATLRALGLSGVTLSQELTMRQIEALPDCGIALEAAVYGRQALMASAHCPAGAESAGEGRARCNACAGHAAPVLVDRKGKGFPVLCDPIDCRSMVLNADTLAVPGLAGRLARAGVSTLRLAVFDEPPEEVGRLLALFRRHLAGEAAEDLGGEGYTKGHYFRGV